MKADGAAPLVGDSARALGVRVTADVAPDAENNVGPGAGMSVTPDDPFKLPPHRRPEAYGGSGDDPVWAIAEEVLPARLMFSLDRAFHGVICPLTKMALSSYRSSLGRHARRLAAK